MAASTPGSTLPENRAAEGGTRWRRSAVVALPALAVLAVLGSAMLRGALPVGVSMSDANFSLSASLLTSDEPIAFTDARDSGLSASAAHLDGACLAMRPRIPGTPLHVSIVLSMPGAGSQASNLDVASSGVRIDSARLEASKAEPIVLGTDSLFATAASHGAFGLTTGTHSSLGGVHVDTRSSSLSATVKPAHGLSLHVITSGDRTPTCH